MKLFNKYKFSDKSQTLGGMISTVMGLAALVSFGYGIYIAFHKFYTFSRAGSLMCGIFAIFMVAVLMMGIV